MEKSSEKTTKFSLRLLVDEKRNKVVLAESCMYFVDVLFSLLTLPMGTIVRLLENHKSQKLSVGCFNNIYKSVSDMAIDNFETEACKSMLLYPRSTKEIHCRKLKLNIDDTEATKFFTCSKESCKQYSNFNTSRCSCGDLMTKQLYVSEEDQIGSTIRNNEDGVFVRYRSSYIITDDLRVTLSSLGVISNELKLLGYGDVDDLQETHLDVGFEEVLTLLGNMFASEYPLSHTFLKKPHLERLKKPLSTPTVEVGCFKGGHEYHAKIFDKKIFYVECSEDFVDSLLSLLALPLELAWSLSNDNAVLGCVGNLCRSECRKASASSPLEIPYYYTCSKQILDIPSHPAMIYSYTPLPPLLRDVNTPDDPSPKIISVIPTDPKVKSGTPSKYGVGFVKRGTRFIVTDDLVITPMSSSSTIGLFMKNRINNRSDLEEHEVSISKTELFNILRASLISRSALTNGLSRMLTKNPKKQVLGIL